MQHVDLFDRDLDATTVGNMKLDKVTAWNPVGVVTNTRIVVALQAVVVIGFADVCLAMSGQTLKMDLSGFLWISLDFTDFLWFSLIFAGFHSFALIFRWISLIFASILQKVLAHFSLIFSGFSLVFAGFLSFSLNFSHFCWFSLIFTRFP